MLRKIYEYDADYADELEDRRRAAHVALVDASERYRDANGAFQSAQARLAAWNNENGARNQNPASLVKAVEDAEEVLRRRTVARDKATAAWERLGYVQALTEEIAAWKKKPGARVITRIRAETTARREKLNKKLEKNTNSVAALVGAIREELQAITEERDWITNAPLPAAEAVEQVLRHIDELDLRSRAKETLGRLIYPGGQSALDDFFELHATVDGRADSGVVFGNATIAASSMLIAFDRAAVETFVRDHINGLSYEPGPPAAERAALLADLERQAYKLEVDEEDTIRAAESLNVSIPRRRDCRADIVFDLEVVDEDVHDSPLNTAIDIKTPGGRELSRLATFDI